MKKAEQRETVIITSGPGTAPVAALEAIRPIAKKRLGVMETPGFALTDAFFEPLPDEDCGE